MAILELRKKSQVTIPIELVNELGLKIGDKLNAFVDNGKIVFVPVVVYPKKEMERIAKLIKEAEDESADGNSKVYDNVSDAFKDMGIDVDAL